MSTSYFRRDAGAGHSNLDPVLGYLVAGVVWTVASIFVQHLHECVHFHRVVGVGLLSVNEAAVVAALGVVDYIRMAGYVNVLSGGRE